MQRLPTYKCPLCLGNVTFRSPDVFKDHIDRHADKVIDTSATAPVQPAARREHKQPVAA